MQCLYKSNSLCTIGEDISIGLDIQPISWAGLKMSTRREESFKEGMRKAVEYTEHAGQKRTTRRGTSGGTSGGTSVRARACGRGTGGGYSKNKAGMITSLWAQDLGCWLKNRKAFFCKPRSSFFFSIAVANTTTNSERKEFICLAFIAGSQARTQAGTMEERHLLACFSRLAHATFLYNPGLPVQGWHHLQWHGPSHTTTVPYTHTLTPPSVHA